MRTSGIAILLLAGSMAASAQSRYEPFTGGFEIGLGYGTVIDFNLENNNLHREYLLEKLIWLPFQVSLFSNKYLDQNRYLEFGVSFARKSSSHVKRHYHLDGSFGSGLPVLEPVCRGFCLDHKRSRIKLQAELSATSIVKADYRRLPPEDRAYGGRIHPFGVLVCFARVFRQT